MRAAAAHSGFRSRTGLFAVAGGRSDAVVTGYYVGVLAPKCGLELYRWGIGSGSFIIM